MRRTLAREIVIMEGISPRLKCCGEEDASREEEEVHAMPNTALGCSGVLLVQMDRYLSLDLVLATEHLVDIGQVVNTLVDGLCASGRLEALLQVCLFAELAHLRSCQPGSLL